MDRAPDFESVGWGFESLQACQGSRRRLFDRFWRLFLCRRSLANPPISSTTRSRRKVRSASRGSSGRSDTGARAAPGRGEGARCARSPAPGVYVAHPHLSPLSRASAMAGGKGRQGQGVGNRATLKFEELAQRCHAPAPVQVPKIRSRTWPVVHTSPMARWAGPPLPPARGHSRTGCCGQNVRPRARVSVSTTGPSGGGCRAISSSAAKKPRSKGALWATSTASAMRSSTGRPPRQRWVRPQHLGRDAVDAKGARRDGPPGVNQRLKAAHFAPPRRRRQAISQTRWP